MAIKLLANTRAGRDNRAPAPSLHADGTPYPLRMFYDSNSRIADADTHAELMSVLIPSYLDMSHAAQLEARLALGRSVQQLLRATILERITNEEWEALSEVERALLSWDKEGEPYGWEDGSKEPKSVFLDEPVEQSAPDLWQSEHPLVLLDATYAYAGAPHKPVSHYGDFEFVPNIIFLYLYSDEALLDSLDRVGYIVYGSPSS